MIYFSHQTNMILKSRRKLSHRKRKPNLQLKMLTSKIIIYKRSCVLSLTLYQTEILCAEMHEYIVVFLACVDVTVHTKKSGNAAQRWFAFFFRRDFVERNRFGTFVRGMNGSRKNNIA